MKKLKLIIMIILLGTIGLFKTQTTSSSSSSNSTNSSGLRMSIRGGYDIPAFGNNTPYIDYKGGLMAGVSLDYYWNWFGIGGDFDYINNKPQSTYPTANLFSGTSAVTNFVLLENSIKRMFYGIGPSFKYQRNNNSYLELKLRGGLSTIKGGKTSLTGDIAGTTTLLNFHAGYNLTNSLAAKASLQYNYLLTKNFGFHIGAYYLQHFKATELVDPTLGISSAYYSFNPASGAQGTPNSNNLDILNVRKEPCNCEIHSVGVYAGVSIKFSKGEKCNNCPPPPCRTCQYCNVCGKTHEPPMCVAPCNTCGCDVVVTAKDKFTGEVLANTDVVLTDEGGNIVQSGTTNSFGTVVFKNVLPNNYTVKGKLYNVDLSQNQIIRSEFDKCKSEGKPIQKEIVYTDENFIIKGKVVVCNTTSPVDGVQVVLKDVKQALQKSTNTDSKGEFVFHALQKSNYTIYGKKANYLSQTENISTSDYDRSKTLFIKLEICLDPADCGKAIVLKNILYDLDKFFIREDAKPELNRLVQFMNDNPEVRVELSSHTDCRESHAYNQKLSQNRANAAVDYIVSQGISRSRLIGKGYGETRLLNRCADGVSCSEAEHQINRRTEVKVICPGDY